MTEDAAFIKDKIADLVADLLYYDRKEDEACPVGMIDRLVAAGAVTVEEMAAEFARRLREGLQSR